MKRLLITFSLLTIAFWAGAQKFGNEWIKYSQDYYKFEIGQDGFYRISSNDLTTAGIAVSSIDPRNIQLFKNGEEQFIFVSGESDGSMDAGDYIEFYATKNDGSLDEVLYRKPEEHTNPFVSLYNDTAAYFLTISPNSSTKHLTTYQDLNFTGKTPDDYFTYISEVAFNQDEFGGVPNANTPEQSFSEYSLGEGYLSTRDNRFKEFKIATPSISPDVSDAEMATFVAARNNPTEFHNGTNHGLGIAVGTKTDILENKIFSGYNAFTYKFRDLNFDASLLKNETSVFIGEIDPVNRPLSYFTVAYIQIKYGRTYDLAGLDQLNFNTTSSNDYFEFTNYNNTKTTPIIYDLTNGNRIEGSLTGTTLRFNTSQKNSKELILFDASSLKSVTKFKKLKFSPIPKNGANYLIITHKNLASSASDYSAYRESGLGGGFKTLTLYADELYDQFYYGLHHPMAIRNAIYFLLDGIAEPIENVLLLGKGQTYNEIHFNAIKRETLDLVPTIGSPPSDYLFVSPLDASSLAIRVPIGRVPAKTDDEVRTYLAKVQDHEDNLHEEWKKKIIQIVGGKTEHENTNYKGYLDQYFQIAKDSLLGAKRSVFSKDEAVSVSKSLIEQIQSSIDSGATIFNYFGHGSAEVLEVDIGDVTTLDNKGKYPFFVFNGCALGNVYVQSSLGEKFLLEPDKGGVSWLAGTGFGFTDPLRNYTLILHEELLQKQYGQSIGKALKTTINRFQVPSNALNVINCRQLAYIGDPALGLNLPDKSDLIARNGSVVNDFSAIEDVRIKFGLVNLAKVISDSVTIKVVADNSSLQETVYSGLLASPKYIAETILTLEKSKVFSGLVTFTITLDTSNSIDEVQPLGETNNVYRFEHLFELQKPLLVYPRLNSIVNTSDVEFVFHIANQEKLDTDIEIQIDTTPYFFNNGIAQFNFTVNTSLVRQKQALPPFDNIDYFYRIRSKKSGVLSEWSTSSFAYLFDDNVGWSEEHVKNLENTNLEFLLMDTASGDFEFASRLSNNYGITTNGRYPTTGFNWNRMVIAGEINIIRNVQNNGVHIAAIHPNTEKRWSHPSSYNIKYPSNPYWVAAPQENQKEYYVAGNYTGIYYFQSYNKKDQDSMLAFIKSIPDGYHILMHNDRQTGIETWDTTIFDELEKFGIYNLRNIKEFEPFALYGTKGKPSQSIETYGDYSDTDNPPINQEITSAWNLTPKVTDGAVVTEYIGPSTKWNRVAMQVAGYDSETDSFDYAVIGIDAQDDETTLYANITDSVFDITAIDAKTYPYLKLKLNFHDKDGYTPLDLKRWTVYYEGVTEGAIDVDDLNEISADTVQRGEAISFATKFKNISDLTFDSAQAIIRLVHKSGFTIIVDTIQMDSIKPGQSVTLQDTLNTVELAGDYQLFVTANFDKKVTEGEYNNNLFYKKFHVTTDGKHPYLDVTFDAIHILNRDIVSANTLITITGKDENEFLFLDDPSLFDVQLKHPYSDTFVTIDQSDPMFTFQPATSPNEKAVITYQTDQLPDGIYTLKVNLMDRTGNGSNTPPYIIDFQVVSKQTITNIYPYPNPFTTCAKFVFTCTGSEVPERMLISIYTITGRLVKQIDETELGPLRIGNNMTEYCWDGTDNYGDKLANGVYLYKAEIQSNGQTVELSETSSDHLFVNGFGKLYIAR